MAGVPPSPWLILMCLVGPVHPFVISSSIHVKYTMTTLTTAVSQNICFEVLFLMSVQTVDVEGYPPSGSVASPDPFRIRHGLKSDQEIAELRRRRKGLAKYQRKQNDVCQCMQYYLQPQTLNTSNSSSPLY
jgi:hypothetical protein